MTATLVLPTALREAAGGLPELEIAEGTVRSALDLLAGTMPLLERRVRDEQGRVRPHIRLYLGSSDIEDLQGLDTMVGAGSRLYVIPAVSGG
ncbi:MAG: MoaD/ThiS family protein [Candidatus Dormibacteraeota bacterium]|nr:MoaD/ThiS family protein [Candidatus Dormibacteraeota bacterium]